MKILKEHPILFSWMIALTVLTIYNCFQANINVRLNVTVPDTVSVNSKQVKKES